MPLKTAMAFHIWELSKFNCVTVIAWAEQPAVEGSYYAKFLRQVQKDCCDDGFYKEECSCLCFIFNTLRVCTSKSLYLGL